MNPIICGVDEAGRGPLAGPVVTSAVIFDQTIFIQGVKDSKKLSKNRRESLFDEILEKCYEYSIVSVDNLTIDDINILNSTMLGMEKCLMGINCKKMKIMIDGNYFVLKNNNHLKYNFETIVKGDDRIFAISCASILAKVTRDRIMEDFDEEFPLYNFKNNKGYPTKQHIEQIKKYGITRIHRKSFCKKFLE
ncbi:MAG TPA: ribonuclease HII [Ignavibacteria bacterium]